MIKELDLFLFMTIDYWVAKCCTQSTYSTMLPSMCVSTRTCHVWTKYTYWNMCICYKVRLYLTLREFRKRLMRKYKAQHSRRFFIHSLFRRHWGHTWHHHTIILCNFKHSIKSYLKFPRVYGTELQCNNICANYTYLHLTNLCLVKSVNNTWGHLISKPKYYKIILFRIVPERY